MLSIQVTYCVRKERMKKNMAVRDLEAIFGVSKTYINAIHPMSDLGSFLSRGGYFFRHSSAVSGISGKGTSFL